MKNLILLVAVFISPYILSAQLHSIRPNKIYNEVAIRISGDMEDRATKKDDEKRIEPVSIDFLKENTPIISEKIKEQLITLSNTVEERKKFSMPLPNFKMTSRYGMRMHPILRNFKFHSGIDLRANSDTVKCVLDGVVVNSGYNDKLGYFVKVNHNGNYSSIYGHLSQYFVKSEQIVYAGDVLGITGSTGRSTGEHLHFGVYYKDDPMDPVDFLTKVLDIQNSKIHAPPYGDEQENTRSIGNSEIAINFRNR